VSPEPPSTSALGPRSCVRPRVLFVVFLTSVAAAGVWVSKRQAVDDDTALSSQSKRQRELFYPSPAQWATLTVEPVQQRVFKSERVTEGKIAVDEDRSTPIFSPYAGRVMKLFAKPGDVVKIGQPLFTVQGADMVQAQNDFISASTTLNKARSASTWRRSTTNGSARSMRARRSRSRKCRTPRPLSTPPRTTCVPPRSRWKRPAIGCAFSARPTRRSPTSRKKGTIDPATPIYAPIGGTIVQRKVGPGQYVGSGASDPVCVPKTPSVLIT
jgi:cobalt-zinc-cadmium efflux system membrane fusion protein